MRYLDDKQRTVFQFSVNQLVSFAFSTCMLSVRRLRTEEKTITILNFFRSLSQVQDRLM